MKFQEVSGKQNSRFRSPSTAETEILFLCFFYCLLLYKSILLQTKPRGVFSMGVFS